MKLLKIIGSLLLIPLGVFLVVYGGYDDSPGGQLLGLVIAIAGVVCAIRSAKNRAPR